MSFHSTVSDSWYFFYLLIIYRHPRYLTPCYIYFFLNFFDKNFKVDIIMITRISRYIKNLQWMARLLLCLILNPVKMQLIA